MTAPSFKQLITGNAAFRRLWLGDIVSMLGDWFGPLALYTMERYRGDASARFLLGLSRFQSGLLVAALALAGACGGVERPPDPNRPTPAMLDARVSEAGARLRSGDAEGAVEVVASVLSHDERRAEAHRIRARALLQLRRPELALAAASTAVRLDLDDVLSWQLLTRAQGAAGRWMEATETAATMVLIAPTHVEAWLTMADALEQIGEPARAARAVERAVLIAPSDPRVQARLRSGP